MFKYVDEDFAKNAANRETIRYNTNIWKKIVYLPAEPVWYYTIIILNYLTTLGHLALSVDGECKSEKFLNLHILVIFNIMDTIYLADIILEILCKSIRNLDLPEINISTRPVYIIVMELLSLVPLQLIIPGTDNDKIKYCMLRLNVTFRIFRILYFHYKHNALSATKIYMKVLELLSYAVFVVLVTFAVYCNLFCACYTCIPQQTCTNQNISYIIAKVIGAGYSVLPANFVWEFITTIAQMTFFYCIRTVTMAHITIGFIMGNWHQIRYLNRSNIFVDRLRKLNLPKRLVDSTIEYFNIIWKKTSGYSTNSTYLRFLHESMINELMIDISWPALKHSSLFRSMDLNYLRYLSNFIRLEYMLPGQYVFIKDEWKGKMVYVVSGTVQLISNEDGESPLMSLCAGTCIGESSLVVDYKSLNNVICKTFCEFHILTKFDFIRSYLKYPNEYKMAKEIIFERYKNTRVLNNISTVAKSKLATHRNIDIYNLLWVKNTLHKLMAVDHESTYRHEFQNIYLINEINENDFNKLSFTARYLDMLVVGERIEVDTDTVFVQIKCPCILQPSSIIGIMWETLIIFLTLILSFTIPVMSFIEKEQVAWYYPTVCFITHIFWVDIYIQLSTAIRSKHGVFTKIKTISKVKMQTFGLWVDIISCIPCEMFTSIIAKSINPQIQARLHINRLLKLWRVERLFRLWESKFNANLVLVRYIKFTWINLYTVFFLYCLMYYFSKSRTMYMLFASVQVVAGTNIIDKSYNPSLTLTLLGDVSSLMITIVMYASIMSAYILLHLKRFEVQHMCVNILNVIKKRNLSNHFKERVMNIFYTEWDDNECTLLKHADGIAYGIPTYVYEEIMCYLSEEIVMLQKEFSGFSDIAIYEICSKMKFFIWASNEPIISAGHIPKVIYFILQGTCDVLNGEGEIVATITNGGAFNFIEAIFNTPTMNTVIARSNCKCLRLEYKDLAATFYKYIEDSEGLLEVIASSNDFRKSINNKIHNNKFDVTSLRMKKKPNFHKFKLFSIESDFDEYDYYIPFDRLYPFAFIRYFLMHTTINCEGQFIFCWEISRSIFAFFIGLLYFILPLYMSKYRIFLYLLDVTGVVDIYIRLHVTYFDSDGLLISHPLKTAINYLRRAFLVDFIAVLPIGLLDRSYSSKIMYSHFLLHLNKLLPMYRYLGFFRFIDRNTLTPLHKAYGLTFIPIVLLTGNFFGSFLISRECSFGQKTENDQFVGLICANNSILALSPFNKPIDSLRAHLYGWYIGVSMLTTSGMQGFVVSSSDNRYIIMVMSIVGLYLTVIFAGKNITLYFFHHRLLLKYQEAMRALNKFLNITKVNPQLKRTIIDSYELKWSLHKGKDMHQIFEPLGLQFQYDILYEIYGKELYETSIFTMKSKAFYTNLMPMMKHDIISKGGYVITINDVCKYSYILYKGIVEVLAPDGTVLTILHPGSMFGNLEEKPWFRQHISVVTNCHVEVLMVPSIIFYQFLNYEPLMKNEYSALILQYVNYIPGRAKRQMSRDKITHVRKIESFWHYVFNPNTRGMQFCSAFNLIFSCYLCVTLSLYQLGVGEYSMCMMVLQYTGDFVYVAHYLITLRTAYEDNYGILITDLKCILKHHCENKLHFWIGIISLLPLDLFILPLESIEYPRRMFLYGLLRLNRLLRLKYIFDYFTYTSEKLNINVYIMRFGFVLFWSSLALHGITAATLSISCTFTVNIEPAVPPFEQILNMTSFEKFKLYISIVYFAADFLNFGSQNMFYPNGAVHICFFIAIMVISQNLFFICISQIYSVMSECNRSRVFYVNDVQRLKNFMDNEDVSLSLVDRIVKYTQMLWLHQKGDIFPSLLVETSPYLQDAILNDAFLFLLIDHPIFAKCHTDCLRQIIQKCTAETFFTGDYVQFKGVIDNRMYFIFTGKVVVLHDESVFDDDIVQFLKQGDSFGVKQGLHHKLPHEYSYKAIKRTLLVILDFKLWEYLLPFFPASQEKICNAVINYEGF